MHNEYGLTERYLNPFTDFGFKKIFGSEPNKEIPKAFLNELLKDREQIVELSFKPSEQLGLSSLDRKAILDLYCQNEKGEKFIIELQKTRFC